MSIMWVFWELGRVLELRREECVKYVCCIGEEGKDDLAERERDFCVVF